MCSQRTEVRRSIARMASALLAGVTFSAAVAVKAESFTGVIGSSAEWGSAWMNLAPAVDFKTGDKLRVTIGGTAKKVVVRLLPKGQSPDTSVGVVGRPVDVSHTKFVVVSLPEDRKQIVQISVHGGPNPWNEFDLGADNGPATIKAVERIKP